MFTFLAPAALFGSLLLAIPIVVHLLKPRKMRQTPFSSLRWLKQTQQRLSRRIQWHQWLLFLLRASLIVLLVLAIAKPLVYSGGDNKPADRFVILDVSRSMGYQPKGQPSTMEKARQMAANLVAQGGAGNRTAVLLTGARTRLLSPLTHDATIHVPALQATRAGASDTNLSSALPIIRPMLQHARPNSDVELFFFTDNHQQSWQQNEIAAFMKDLPVTVGVHVVELGPGFAQNAWIAGARLLPAGRADYRILRVEVGCVGDSKQERSLRLAGLKEFEDSQAVTLTPGRLERVDFKIPAGLNLRGQVAELRLEPADSLPSDDQFFVNLDTTGALRILLVEPAKPAADERNVGLYLRTAVEALAASGNHALELNRRTSGSVTGGDFKEADVVVLAGVPELPDAALDSLENRVRSGGGLVVFLGPDLKPAFYNNKLHRPLQPAEGLLPVPLKTGPDVLVEQGNPGLLTNIRWAHPILAPLYDPVLGDLPQSRFRFHCAFAGAPGKGDTVLARIDDGVPALIEHPLGAGRVFVFNTTANDAWSDLPRRKSFVPLLDRVLTYLSAGGAQRSFTVGEAVSLPLADRQDPDQVAVITPTGGKIVPRLSSVSGKWFLHLDETTEPGVYRVERSGKSDESFTFVVNVGRGDSVLSPMDAGTLRQWWEPASFEIIQADAAGQRFTPQDKQWILWPWLIFLGGLVLLAEMYVVHRLCPRVNPAVVESVVPGRGLLKKTAEIGKES